MVIWRRLRLVPTFHEVRYRRVAWAHRLSENVRGARRRAYGAYGTVCLRDSVHGGRRMVPSRTARILGFSNCLQMCCHFSSSNPRWTCAPSGTDQSFRCLASLQRVFGRSILTRREQLIGQLQYHQEPRKKQ